MKKIAFIFVALLSSIFCLADGGDGGVVLYGDPPDSHFGTDCSIC